MGAAPHGGFRPPPYPYDRLEELRGVADGHEGGCVDLSVGTPCDPPPPSVLDALASSGTERGYPPSAGTEQLRSAAAAWIADRFGVQVAPDRVAACVGTKELVVGLPHLLRLRTPDRDTVLYPAVSYPSYAMGAELAGCRAVAVPVDDRWCLDLAGIDPRDADRALCLWVNSPGNPAGGLEDLAAVAEWGRRFGVPVFSDECYVEFTWDGAPRSILQDVTDGVVAVHSLSKRSNLAGLRVGFYAGDRELVGYLREVRKHAGLMVPGPAQAAGAAALGDRAHVEEQRARYRVRLERGAEILQAFGAQVESPGGGFYLWGRAPGDDSWALTRRLATEGGVLVSPGEFYGDARYVRAAMVQGLDSLDLAMERFSV